MPIKYKRLRGCIVADGQALTRAFMSIRDAGQRRCIVILVEAMAR
jgi:hypothetical protein